MYLLCFETIGLYIYASTETIMNKALKQIGLQKFESKRIDTEEGDILRIDKNGKVTRSEFEPKLYRSKYMSWYDDSPTICMRKSYLLTAAAMALTAKMLNFYSNTAIPAMKSRRCWRTTACSVKL